MSSSQLQNRYKADLRDFQFLLFEQFRLGEILASEKFSAWGEDDVKMALEACYKFVCEVLGPLNAVGDPAKCHPCQIVPTCFKSCGRCQLCIGKDTIPADCYQTVPDGGTPNTDGGTTVSCPPGLCTYGQACGVSGCGPCKPGFYCITGCCVPTIG